MPFNPHSKKLETKLYFIVFILVASFVAIVIHSFAAGAYLEDEQAASVPKIIRPHLDLPEN